MFRFARRFRSDRLFLSKFVENSRKLGTSAANFNSSRTNDRSRETESGAASPASNPSTTTTTTSESEISPSISRALSKLIEPNRVLPKKYTKPEYEAIIHQCRADVQAQIQAGAKPRMPYRLWKLVFSKANNYTAEQYNNLSPEERNIHGDHWRAMQDRLLTYKDRYTGYDVMTMAALLLQGRCCGNGCRHCPYDHENASETVRNTKKWNGSYYV